MLVEDMLADLGAFAAAHAGSVEEGISAAKRDGLDIAILDMNLGGAKVFPVAEILRAQGTPFVFASGYGAGGVPPEFSGYPIVAKPFAIEELARALTTALSVQRDVAARD